MATKLSLINGGLTALGSNRISDTGEAVESAREMTAVYDNVVAECLSVGSWNFATETIKATADTGVVPSFGYTEVFAKPTDWVRTVAISEDEYFSLPLLHYYDDDNFWSADYSPIYIRYVSNDTGLGNDLSRWTPLFSRYVELELAARTVMRLTQNASLEEAIEKKRDKARKWAKNQDSMDTPQPIFPPPGSWTMSRGGRSGRERGSRNNLTG